MFLCKIEEYFDSLQPMYTCLKMDCCDIYSTTISVMTAARNPGYMSVSLKYVFKHSDTINIFLCVSVFIYSLLWCNHTSGINVCVCFLHPYFSKACCIIDGYLLLNCTCACLCGSLYGMGNITYWVLIMQDRLHMNNCQTASVHLNTLRLKQNGHHCPYKVFKCIFW